MLLVVGNAGDSVLAPAVGARAGMVVGEEIPGVTSLAVVLTHGPPLPFTEVGSPLLPKNLPFPGLFKSALFSVHTAPPRLFACNSSGVIGSIPIIIFYQTGRWPPSSHA